MANDMGAVQRGILWRGVASLYSGRVNDELVTLRYFPAAPPATGAAFAWRGANAQQPLETPTPHTHEMPAGRPQRLQSMLRVAGSVLLTCFSNVHFNRTSITWGRFASFHATTSALEQPSRVVFLGTPQAG